MNRQENPVGLDDVFFSTTDDKGRITLANKVFVRLSKYPLEELVGAPHNIVRHPDMPAGVFRVMWDALEAERPFAGFVRNRSADGSPYEVLATVTPLPAGGYLSVRTRPMTEAADRAFALYAEAREQERAAEHAGRTRREAARDTAAALPEALGAESYERFQWGLLPAELAAREAAGAALPDAPAESGAANGAADGGTGTGSPDAAVTAKAAAAEMIAALHRAHDLLGDWTRGQEETGALTEELSGLTARVSEAAGAGERVRAAADELDLTGPQRTLLLAPLQIWANMHGIVGGYLEELSGLIERVDRASREALFSLALVRLQTAAAGTFAVEPGAADSPESLTALCTALKAGIDSLDEQVTREERLVTRLNSKAGSVARIMEPVQGMIAGWLDDTDVEHLTGGARELVETVSAAAEETRAAAAQLTAASGSLSALARPDVAELRHLVAEVEDALQRATRGW
ncbi:PAS domain-containing protein [Corynebacterium frankenforstense]|uniref:PAS domain-containing protein n=1 Tax=Corynebacterium frankenforstense TaxID=1230998 RepID=UPI000953526E|nr:PAS domain-containing protein [Corynebacterium frankenforstense]